MTQKRLHSANFSRQKPVNKMPKLIFADFSELDCHKDVDTGIVNYKELEMCRYLEHRKRME